MRDVVLFASTEGADEHRTGDHPERTARLGAVRVGLEAAGLLDLTEPVSVRSAGDDALGRAHDLRYVRALEQLVAAGGTELDPDTPLSAGSVRTARLAAGAGLAAIDALAAGGGKAAFVNTRPPGHHASRSRGMGFCLVNNVAVGAAALADAGERVAIVDWDVHHGNGTQAIFWDDPRVLYASLHQWPAYPGTGAASEVGGPGALGSTVNVPLPPGATGDAARRAFEEVVLPALAAFVPTWLLVSAGYDAHRDDPLADLCWSAADYGDLARLLLGAVPLPGRTVVYLEGGYDLPALARSAASTIGALVGVDPELEAASRGGPGADAVASAARARAEALGG